MQKSLVDAGLGTTSGVGSSLKLVFIPQARNKIQFRLQNLEDTFDAGAQTYPVNMTTFVEAIWLGNNRGTPVPKYDLTEMSITGNMPKAEMVARQIKWKTVPLNEEREAPKLVEDKDGIINIAPQQIRVFELTFHPSSLDNTQTEFI